MHRLFTAYIGWSHPPLVITYKEKEVEATGTSPEAAPLILRGLANNAMKEQDELDVW